MGEHIHQRVYLISNAKFNGVLILLLVVVDLRILILSIAQPWRPRQFRREIRFWKYRNHLRETHIEIEVRNLVDIFGKSCDLFVCAKDEGLAM